MLHRYSLGGELDLLKFESVAITYYDEPMSTNIVDMILVHSQ